MRHTQRRIGIYTGTFDPVHAGHVSFALYAQKRARLDSVFFLPERRPRYKPHVVHVGHRIIMLKEALRPYPSLGVIELVEANFSVTRTLPHLRGLFGDSQLVYLFGSDVFRHIPDWPFANVLADGAEFVVGIRDNDDPADMEKVYKTLSPRIQTPMILNSLHPDVGSRQIRDAIRRDRYSLGMLESARRYAKREWLYIKVAGDNRALDNH